MNFYQNSSPRLQSSPKKIITVLAVVVIIILLITIFYFKDNLFQIGSQDGQQMMSVELGAEKTSPLTEKQRAQIMETLTEEEGAPITNDQKSLILKALQADQ